MDANDSDDNPFGPFTRLYLKEMGKKLKLCINPMHSNNPIWIERINDYNADWGCDIEIGDLMGGMIVAEIRDGDWAHLLTTDGNAQSFNLTSDVAYAMYMSLRIPVKEKDHGRNPSNPTG